MSFTCFLFGVNNLRICSHIEYLVHILHWCSRGPLSWTFPASDVENGPRSSPSLVFIFRFRTEERVIPGGKMYITDSFKKWKERFDYHHFWIRKGKVRSGMCYKWYFKKLLSKDSSNSGYVSSVNHRVNTSKLDGIHWVSGLSSEVRLASLFCKELHV